VSLDAVTRPAAGEPEGAIVLLHGRGANERDLFPILDMLDPERRLLGATPRGPLALPPGGAHWYAVHRIGYPDPDTFFPTWAELQDWFDSLPVPAERTVIGGFSQGTVMSYALGLAAGRPRPAGILALSGFIPEVPGLEFELESRAGLPVMIAHGEHDPVIDVSFARAARDRLTAAGLDVSYRESAMGHTIDPRVLPDLQEWLPL
jgi:phospholipase/carboxylesterase